MVACFRLSTGSTILDHVLRLLLHINSLGVNGLLLENHPATIRRRNVAQRREKLEGLGAPVAEFGPQAASFS